MNKLMNDNQICQPIIMIGMPRSGTTVFAEAVAAHENIGWISNYTNRLPMLPWRDIFFKKGCNVENTIDK